MSQNCNIPYAGFRLIVQYIPKLEYAPLPIEVPLIFQIEFREVDTIVMFLKLHLNPDSYYVSNNNTFK